MKHTFLLIILAFGCVPKEGPNRKPPSASDDETQAALERQGSASSSKTMRPPGLSNEGNTCFMNAALQNLLNIGSLSGFYEQEEQSNYFLEHSPGAAYRDLVLQYRAHATNSKPYLVTGSFCPLAWKEFGFRKGRQQDSAEFLNHLLESISAADISPLRLMQDGTFAAPFEDILKTKAAQTFKIFYKNEISSDQCLGQKSVRYESANILRLGVFPTLDQALDDFFRAELEEWRCSRTQSNVGAVGNFRLLDTPQTLIVQLKRFEVSPSGRSQKDTELLPLPLILDVKKYVDESATIKGTRYRLSGIVVHSGSLNMGHYTAYLRQNDEWFFANDERVIPFEDIQTLAAKGHFGGKRNTPYILFYEKI